MTDAATLADARADLVQLVPGVVPLSAPHAASGYLVKRLLEPIDQRQDLVRGSTRNLLSYPLVKELPP